LAQSSLIGAVLQGLASDAHGRGGLDLSECFLDASFCVAKMGSGVGVTESATAANHGAGYGHGLPIATTPVCAEMFWGQLMTAAAKVGSLNRPCYILR